MKLNDWLDTERGRHRQLAKFFKVHPTEVTRWKTQGVPRERMLEVRAFTKGEVTLEEMLQFFHRDEKFAPPNEVVN